VQHQRVGQRGRGSGDDFAENSFYQVKRIFRMPLSEVHNQPATFGQLFQ
jgi:hypothetical protein